MSVASSKAKLAGLVAHRDPADPADPAVTDARRDLKYAVAEDRIRALVDSWPPLTPGQRAELAALLTDPAGGDDGA